MKNVTEFVSRNAESMPHKVAVSFGSRKLTFIELEEKINQFCHKLVELGVKPQDKVLFFVKPNLEFSALSFALFRLGAVSVFIDPGMKKEYFLKAIEEVSPDVFIGIPKAHILRFIKPQVFKSVRLTIQTGRVFGLGKMVHWGLNKKGREFKAYSPKGSDLAAILYTSGGTGAPKGVEYTHDIFINQTKMLRDTFDLSSKDIDIPGFPLFSFFSIAIGMHSHVPQIDAGKPISVDPSVLYDEIRISEATFLAGSPAIWNRLADYCLEKNLKLPSVKHVVMFGAPVDIKLHQKFSQILLKGTTFTPYGATECLPVTCISGVEILKNHKKAFVEGEGICVGRPISGIELKIIRMSEGQIKSFKDCEELPIGDIGEIVVHSKNVTEKYYEKEEATKLSKIYEEKKVWHRMGDVGYLDKDGNLWFCGRKKHVVCDGKEYFYPAQIESVFNQHSKVARSALIQDLKTKKPIVVIQRKDRRAELDSMLLMDLKNLAQIHEKTKKIGAFKVKSEFPLDVRHNIKIDRELLAQELSK